MTFPELHTDRLLLRQLRADDAEDLFSYFSLDQVTEFYDLDSFTNCEQARELILSWVSRYERQEGIRWGITLKSENRVIGTCGFHNWFKEHFKAEVGYELHPDYWRQGIMSEAVNAIVGYGFEQLELNRIEAFIDPANEASRRLLTKIGMQEEGLLRACFFEKGKFVDASLFAILQKGNRDK
ncbi:GNAT family N-acetyltransferase [Paenibacillus sp. ACRRX]|uniref:GNAT family N-acetyltransferase n=1 Tax=unclassified Paenibacillus TaxID=185978 RepID=UPI001EF57192|nr:MULTISPECIES: GNAT family N-acetyltransferase [unclassified Paenibacillus]MCG7407330.1 GNAT family N-acetyltransferase [Paenibacillus sp. ACRRX]